MKEILEGRYPSGSGFITVNLTEEQTIADKDNFSKLQQAYDVCLNETAQAEIGFRDLVAFGETITSIFSNNPPNSTGNRTPTGDAIVLFESLGIPSLTTFFVGANDVAPTSDVLTIAPPVFADLPFNASNDTLKEYASLGTPLLAAIHPKNLSSDAATTLFEEVLKFQIEVASLGAQEALLQLSNLSNDSPQPKFGFDELAGSAPQLNLKQIVESLAPSGYKAGDVVVYAPNYFALVSALVEKTSAEILEGFFLW